MVSLTIGIYRFYRHLWPTTKIGSCGSLSTQQAKLAGPWHQLCSTKTHHQACEQTLELVEHLFYTYGACFIKHFRAIIAVVM
jgi:hypothetical protein